MPDCELKGPTCTVTGTKSYQCVYCCIGVKVEVSACAKCYLDLYQKKALICQKPGCVEHAEEIKQQREAVKKAEKEKAALERAEAERSRQVASVEKMRKAKAELDSELLASLGDIERDFQNSPTATLACQDVDRINNRDVKTLVAAAKAAKWTEANIPGAKADQMFEIFYFAFSRKSNVTLGGSRVRAFHAEHGTPYREGEVPYKSTSDLDVGYSDLNLGQVAGCRKMATKVGGDWLPIEEATIIPGHVIGGKKIVSPEEFFQRSGERAVEDLKRKNEGIVRYYPSGSVTFDQNGDATAHPPG